MGIYGIDKSETGSYQQSELVEVGMIDNQRGEKIMTHFNGQIIPFIINLWLQKTILNKVKQNLANMKKFGFFSF